MKRKNPEFLMLGLDYPRITFHGAYLNSEKHNKFFFSFCNMVKLPNIYYSKIINFCTQRKHGNGKTTHLELGRNEIQFHVGVKTKDGFLQNSHTGSRN